MLNEHKCCLQKIQYKEVYLILLFQSFFFFFLRKTRITNLLRLNYKLSKSVITLIFNLTRHVKPLIFVCNLVQVRMHVWYFHFAHNRGRLNIDPRTLGAVVTKPLRQRYPWKIVCFHGRYPNAQSLTINLINFSVTCTRSLIWYWKCRQIFTVQNTSPHTFLPFAVPPRKRRWTT